MDVQTAVSLIGSLGFPIVMCLVLIKYMEQIQQDNKETIEKLTESHKQETDALKESLNNNTNVLVELKTMFQMLTKGDNKNDNEGN